MTGAAQTQYSVRAVTRALDILFCFSRLGRRLSNTEISHAVGLNPSTVHRLLACLQGAGLVSQNTDDRRYRLGPAVAELYQAWDQQFDIRELARPAMQQLWSETQETVGLSVIEGRSRVYVEQLESPQMIRSSFPLGVPQPLHAGAPGKVFLAYGDEATCRAVMSGPLPPLAPRTLTDPALLYAELDKVRRQGYAVSVEEWARGGAAVAAPVFDARGHLKAVLSVSLPAPRLTAEHRRLLIDRLRATTDRLNHLVSGRAAPAWPRGDPGAILASSPSAPDPDPVLVGGTRRRPGAASGRRKMAPRTNAGGARTAGTLLSRGR